MNIAVSIIVPIYNVEKYIKKCLDSIVSQSLKNIEIILINDGSSDKCGEIIDEYALIDKRIRVVHQFKSGPSKARNVGVQMASGEFIGFVDPDDWIDKDMFSILYNAASKFEADSVICGFYEYYQTTSDSTEVGYKFLQERNIGLNTVRHNILVPLLSGKLHSFTWNKLYKRSILIGNNVQSPEDMPLMQDIVFNIKAFSVMENTIYIDQPLYYFRRHSSSNTLKFRPDKFNTLLRLIEEKRVCMTKVGFIEHKYQNLVYEWFIDLTIQVIILEFSSSNNYPLRERISRINFIVNNPEVRTSLEMINIKKNIFHRLFCKGIRRKNTFFVVLISIVNNYYSFFREKLKLIINNVV